MLIISINKALPGCLAAGPAVLLDLVVKHEARSGRNDGRQLSPEETGALHEVLQYGWARMDNLKIRAEFARMLVSRFNPELTDTEQKDLMDEERRVVKFEQKMKKKSGSSSTLAIRRRQSSVLEAQEQERK